MENLRREVFHLAYHLHWSHAEIFDLSTDARRFYLEQLNETLERERRSVESARRGR